MTIAILRVLACAAALWFGSDSLTRLREQRP